MTAQYYTQTPNFISAISDDVDPRTRLFGFQHSLGIVTGNNGMGPELDLALIYSPTTSDNSFHLGTGILIGIPMYDKNNYLLSLSSGESYKVKEHGGKPEIQQVRLKTFTFTKTDEDNYRIIEQNGNITDLRDYGDGLCRPVTLCSPLGRTLTLTWTSSNYGRILSSVSDDSNEVLFQSEHDNDRVEITFLPGHTESYTITLAMTNDYLTSLRSSALPAGIKWSLSYEDVGIGGGLLTLNKIVTPTGLTKTAIYNSGLNIGLIKFPQDAGLPPLPAVTSFSIDPGYGQPTMVIKFSPDDPETSFRNYLAYDSNLGSGWSPDSDNLYGILDDDYVYQTITTQECEGSNPLITTYSYNNYHLLISTQKDQGETSLLTEVEYYANAYDDFSLQPNQFQYPKKQTTTWTDKSITDAPQSYQETMLFSYDEYGNKLQQVSPDGTITNYEYYPSGGETTSTNGYTGCPADPEGFVRLLRSEQTIPASSDYQDAPRKIAYYRYENLAEVTTSLNRNCILPVQETQCLQNDGIETLLLTHLASYINNDSALPDYGRVGSIKATVFDTSGVGYTLTQNHTYEYNSESLTHIQSLQTYDSLQVITQNTCSRYTHQLWSTTDASGNKEEMSYDACGRLHQRTRNAGTEYQYTDNIEYTMELQNGSAVSIYSTYSDDSGNFNKIYFDAMGRPVSYEQKETGTENWFITETRDYDSSGRLKNQTLNDYATPDLIFSVQATMFFDDWGQNYLTEYSSGQREYHVYSPVLRQSVSKLQNADDNAGMGYQLTHYNAMNLPQDVIMMGSDNSPYSEIIYKYDGAGRVREVSDELNHTTRYSYDRFDRVHTQTLADNTVITKNYADFSAETWITSLQILDAISNKTYSLGERTFDSLGRVTSLSCGGREITSQFSSANRVPDSITDAMDNTLQYTYNPHLDNAVSTISGKTIYQSYQYDNGNGLMQSAQEDSGAKRDISWWPSGRIKEEQFNLPDGTARVASYDWTLLGMPLRNTDVTNTVQTVTYDNYGRPWILDDPQLTITLGYDAAGRLVSQSVAAKTGESGLLITLTLDNFGREIQRDFLTSDGISLTLQQKYWKNNQLNNRTLTQEDVVLSQETFTYDLRNRLVDYECQGTSLPVESTGNPISKQHYSYDVLNNVTDCLTTFADGREDMAKYWFEASNDPTQLSRVTHTLTDIYPESVSLSYDTNGRMTEDEYGRVLTYDELGRLVSVQDDAENSEYTYDALGFLILQSLNNNEFRELYYRGDKLVNNISPDKNQSCRFIYNSAVSNEVLSV